MRVVLDTNVLVSAMLVPGSVPGQCVELAVRRRIGWLVDARIVAEYHEVLRHPGFRFEPRSVAALLAVVDKYAEWVAADPLPVRLADASDLPFVEVAVAGGADAIVTGNVADYRIAGRRLAVRVLTPRAFLDVLGGRR